MNPAVFIERVHACNACKKEDHQRKMRFVMLNLRTSNKGFSSTSPTSGRWMCARTYTRYDSPPSTRSLTPGSTSCFASSYLFNPSNP
ncbi:hypothetical protein DPMN_030581 [Dreissena polymorpha]|uniref:Uncharacterized protein n=1 Tax=Dreissena polymorpha TaxID=45954 RepID=A0A9D4M132_DREPO|nr:hypothetical protein DPMN_030581 [Dreissena polymorpha]